MNMSTTIRANKNIHNAELAPRVPVCSAAPNTTCVNSCTVGGPGFIRDDEKHLDALSEGCAVQSENLKSWSRAAAEEWRVRRKLGGFMEQPAWISDKYEEIRPIYILQQFSSFGSERKRLRC